MTDDYLFQRIVNEIKAAEFKPAADFGFDEEALRDLGFGDDELAGDLRFASMPDEFGIGDISATIAHLLQSDKDKLGKVSVIRPRQGKFIAAPREIAQKLKTNLLMNIGSSDRGIAGIPPSRRL